MGNRPVTYLWLTIDSLPVFPCRSVPYVIYHIRLDATIDSPYNGLWKITNGTSRRMFQLSFVDLSGGWQHVLRKCIDHLVSHRIEYDGFVYSGHSGLVNLGKWNPGTTPFFKTSDLIYEFKRARFYFPAMIFNSCYMGGFLSLLECSQVTNWVCADPGYAGSKGLEETNSFWTRTRDDAIDEWLRKVVLEYHSRYAPSEKDDTCYFVFDVRWSSLIWSQLLRADPMKWAWRTEWTLSGDPGTYDFYSVISDRSTPRTRETVSIASSLQQMIHASPGIRGKKRGPSIQWGRYRGVEDRYEGTIWWGEWQHINQATVEGSANELGS